MERQRGIAYTVDWLTVTFKGQAKCEQAADLFYRELEGQHGQMPMTEPWYFKGYRGWSTEGARMGTRNAGDAIVQLSGMMADDLHTKFFELHDNCSRIDLTITVMLDKIDGSVALRAYNALQEQRKLKTTYIQNNRGGATFYSGSRSSRRYGRIYDKGAESGNAAGLVWRYEVEYKKPIAHNIYSLVSTKRGKRDVIRDEVTAYFESIGIEIPGSPTTGYDAMEVPRNLTNSEKKLQWLEKQVQPALRRLIDEGYLLEIYQALGLQPLSPDYPHLGGKDGR